jgi:hypothetical protein
MLKLKFTKEELDNNKGGGGLDIRVPGFACNPAAPDDGQIFIEYYDGELHVRVWHGEQDPETISLVPFDGNEKYLIGLFSEKKDNIDSIGEWDFVLEGTKEFPESLVNQFHMIKFVHKSGKKEIVITPTELWGEVWDSEKEGQDNRNKINVMIVCPEDTTLEYDFTGWKRIDNANYATDNRVFYEKFVDFVWTGEKDTDLMNFIDYASGVIREIEDKYGDIILLTKNSDETAEVPSAEEAAQDAHYDYVNEVLGIDGVHPLGSSEDSNLPKKIGDWEFILNNDRSGKYMEWAYKGNRTTPVYINPSELWNECLEGQENQIGACLISSEDDSAHMYPDSEEKTYDKCEPFEWTGNKEKDLAAYIEHTTKFLKEVEEKHMDILSLHIDDMPA